MTMPFDSHGAYPLMGHEIMDFFGSHVTLLAADEGHLFVSKRPAYFVINTDTSEGPGEHWVAVYMHDYHQGEFFDSYGEPPHFYGLHHFMQINLSNWKYNDIRVQDYLSFTCGHHVVMYITLKLIGVSLEDYISLFTNNLFKNDEMVFAVISNLM